MGSSKKTTTETTDMGPWKVQQPYLTSAFNEAQNLYNANKNTQGYTGDFIAGLTDQQKSQIDSGVNFYNTTGATTGANVSDLSQGLLSSGGSGMGSTAGALTNLSNDIFNYDPTGANISAAGRYADNPYISGMVDNAMLDARRNVAEGVIPSLYRDAAATGNLNSDRTALAQGVVERGLAEKAAGLSSALRGDAYSQGLDLAENARARNMGAGIDALTGAGVLYDAMAGKGLSGTELGSNISDNAIQNALSLSSLYQQNNQDMLDNAMQKQQYAQDRPYDMLSRYYDLVGGNNWGESGTRTSVTKERKSPAETASMIIGSIGSLLKGASGFKF